MAPREIKNILQLVLSNSHVCLSVSHSVYRGWGAMYLSHYCSITGHTETPLHALATQNLTPYFRHRGTPCFLLTCSFGLQHTRTPPPRQIENCSLCSLDCRKASGWHSTEMSSCSKKFIHHNTIAAI